MRLLYFYFPIVRAFLFLFFFQAFFFASDARADLIVHVGPPNLGRGGSNPLGIPPSPIDYEVVYLTEEKREWTFGISPGFFYGQRFDTEHGAYASFGAGIAISGGGAGAGVYSAIGIDICGLFCFNAEYKQAIGAGGSGLIQPSAIRIGVSFFKK